MKIIYCLAFFALLATSSCDNGTTPAGNAGISALQQAPEAPAPVQILRGMYKSAGGIASWYDCTAGKTYWVANGPRSLDSLYREACEPAPCPGEPVYGVVQGRLGPKESAGAASAFDGTLRIIRVDTLAPKTMFNTCMPFDFWCVGTEPFWGLFVSEAGGGFFLKNMGAESGRTFPWAAAVKTGDTWSYTSTDPASGEKIRVQVRKEPCSDGMSERQYNYSVAIQIGRETMKGCAVRQGEAVRRE